MALARQRDEARLRRDFGAADALRAAIAVMGWRVVDSPTGFVLTPSPPTIETYAADDAVPNRLGDPDTCDHSLCIAYHGWPEDVARLLTAVCAGAREGSVEAVLGLASDADDPPAELLGFAHSGLARAPLAVRSPGAGQAHAYNRAARRATGRLVHFVEPSLEFGFEVLEAAASLLEDPAVGAGGPFGLDTSDWRDFQAAEGPEVMALEYLLSIRRGELGRVGEMDPGFRYYRNLDLDFSRQVAAAGLELRSYPAAVQRHAHRLWDSTSPEERERLSRRNFNRMLDRWVRPRWEESAAPPPA